MLRLRSLASRHPNSNLNWDIIDGTAATQVGVSSRSESQINRNRPMLDGAGISPAGFAASTNTTTAGETLPSNLRFTARYAEIIAVLPSKFVKNLSCRLGY
jgi:hypothetical protein